MSDNPTLEQMLARYEPAVDVEDLETARRLVTALREQMAQVIVENMEADGEHTVFLDEEHERMVELLYEQRKLAYEQEDDVYNEEYEFDEVFGDFVQGAIDVAWDLAHDEDGGETFPRRDNTKRITPSA